MDVKDDFIIHMLERLDQKTDEIIRQTHEDVLTLHDTASQQNVLLARYNESLQEHMRRCDLLENRVIPLETDLQRRGISGDLRLARAKKWTAIAATLSALAGGAWYIVQIILKFQ